MPKSAFHQVLKLGVDEGASDIHIREGSPPVIRMAGKLVPVDGFEATREIVDEAIRELCSERDVARFDDVGDCDFAYREEEVGRFRVNLHRQRGLRSFSFRHVKPQVPDFSQLGLPPVIRDIAASVRGIILVTGTTGSGKSTTLAAMLENMNDRFGRRVITIEDPIEFDFEDRHCVFEQREVGLDTASFNSALIHALRQDPDVIVVGEMRDSQGFDTALSAADTGHLVLSTLHTSDAAQSIQRILDFYDEGNRDQIRRSLATTLRAIVSQRLVPRASGDGRVPAMEVMINSPIVRRLLLDGNLEKLPQAIVTSAGDGMMTYNQSLLKLINEGLISEEAGLETSSNPEQLRMNLQGVFLTETSAIIG